MATRRMFSLKITNSARFLRMPSDSQLLYFHLGLHADDDGIVEAYPVLKTLGSPEDNLKVLSSKGFIKVLNEDLVSYITDWSEHNVIRSDRKIDSIYKPLLLQILPEIETITPQPRADTGKITGSGRPMDNQWTAQVRLGEGRLGEGRVGEVKKGTQPDGKEIEIELPLWVDKRVWGEWLEYRKKSRKSMTDITVKKQLDLLFLNKEDHIKIIENSIANGWIGLFPLKKERNNPGTPYIKGKYANDKSIEG